MQGRLFPRSPEERARAEELGYDVSRILYADDLCAGEQVGTRSSSRASRWGPDPLRRRAGGGPILCAGEQVGARSSAQASRWAPDPHPAPSQGVRPGH